MAVRYKIKQIVNSTSSANGKYYGKAFMLDEMDLEEISEKIQQNCSMKKSDVNAVLTELVDVMTDALQDSKKVRIDGLGSFQIGLKTVVAESADEFTSDNIVGYRVNFQPEYTVDTAGNRTTKLLSGVKAQAYEAYIKGVNDKDM